MNHGHGHHLIYYYASKDKPKMTAIYQGLRHQDRISNNIAKTTEIKDSEEQF